MKKFVLFIVLSSVFLLAACASLDTYESRLEDAGWDVETVTEEDLPGIIDEQEFMDEVGISGILYATRGDLGDLEFGFVIEFTDSDDAIELYEFLSEETGEDYTDNIGRRGAFVFFGTSEAFIDDLQFL